MLAVDTDVLNAQHTDDGIIHYGGQRSSSSKASLVHPCRCRSSAQGHTAALCWLPGAAVLSACLSDC